MTFGGIVHDPDYLLCPGECDDLLFKVKTAYGQRAICTREGRKWTRIWGDPYATAAEAPWIEEKYSGMRDNLA